MKKTFTLLLLALISIYFAGAQTQFRSGIFLHHSTGQYIWGPNNDGTSTTTIPDQMHLFNVNHALSGSDSVTLNEEWWAPGDNEWYTQHLFFEGNLPESDLAPYLADNKIIVVKSCFPSSAIEAWGTPDDSLYPDYKTVYNYKWHWRHIINVMANHPANFFAIWTNAPLEDSSTTVEMAALAKLFCTWAKDTLAEGLDPIFGEFPPNVYVFDYFNKITGPDGIEPHMYATSYFDSHPNGAATDLIAPQFVNEIFIAAMEYESVYTAELESNHPMVSIFPNPVQDKLYIKNISDFSFEIFDQAGVLVNSGENKAEIDIHNLPTGIYYVKVTADTGVFTEKLVIQ